MEIYFISKMEIYFISKIYLSLISFKLILTFYK